MGGIQQGELTLMNWFLWALLSAFFAGLTAVLAKIGVQQINSNLATAIRTVVILIFAWAIAIATKNEPFSQISKRTWLFLILSGAATSLRSSKAVLSTFFIPSTCGSNCPRNRLRHALRKQ